MSPQHILVVDDEPGIRSSVKDILEDEGFNVSVAESAEEARILREENAPDLVFLDIWMPGEDGVSLLKEWKESQGLSFPVVMMSGHGTVETAVEATRLGAFDFIEKPLSLAKLLRVTNQALEADSSKTTVADLAGEAIQLQAPIGESRYTQQLKDEYQRAAEATVSILLLGASGVGKTFGARYIHALSDRSEQPFIEVSCSAFQEQNISDELFGNELQGTRGLVELAGTGTLFLSEITDLDEVAQKVLLGLLERKEVLYHGNRGNLPLQARVMASSQYDLTERIEEGLFREDLYYHINVLPIFLQPLHDHAEDVPDALKYYVDYFVGKDNLPYRHFTVAAQNYLRYYSWPGNFRQLRNMVQRLLILGEGEEISQSEVEDVLVRDRVAQAEMTAGLPREVMELPLREAREVFEREYLSRQLEFCRGNVSRLAERVGMERTHLYRKMRALGISPKKNKT